jgi:hypothetical protein
VIDKFGAAGMSKIALPWQPGFAHFAEPDASSAQR